MGFITAHTRPVINPNAIIKADTSLSPEAVTIACAIADFIDSTISFAPGWTGLSVRLPDGAPKTAWFEAWRGDDLAKWSIRAAQRNLTGYGVHLNMLTRKAKLASTVRGGDAECETGFTLWADFDKPDNDMPVKLLASDFPPHLIVASGGEDRFHAYWLLKSLIEPAESVGDILRGLAAMYGEVDEATTRPSTMMRVPGTINWKYEDQRKAQVIYDGEGDFHQYMYSAFASVVKPEDKLVSTPIRRPRVAVAKRQDDKPREIYTAAQIAEMCHGRLVPQGYYLAHCPSPTHGSKGRGDKNESLTIKQADDRVLLNCFGSCELDDIVRGLGIPVSSLFSGESRLMTALEIRASRKAKKNKVLDNNKQLTYNTETYQKDTA